jgi:AcrR family transcriptional regulator
MSAYITNVSSAGTSNRKAAKSEQTQQKLVESGIHLFSTFGYNATTTRNVEAHAQVQRNLITYHFGSKEAFWKACVERLFDGFFASLRPAFDQARDIEAGERIRFLIRQYVRSSAAYPQVMRIMFDEGRCDEWRLEWIVERYSREFHSAVGELLKDGRACGVIPELTHMQFHYALVSGGVMFAMAPEYRLLSGVDPDDEAGRELLVDAQADAIARLLAPQSK